MITPAPVEFERKNIRLPAEYYRGRRLYFVTLCLNGRRRFGANPRVASWLVGRLKHQAAKCSFFVHAYCVMPDHMHVLAGAAAEDSNFLKFVESFKQDTAGEFSGRAGRRLWQSKYYDRILRANDRADGVAWYIWLNPVRKGLCRRPADYPYLGSFTEIGMEMLKCGGAAEWAPPWKGPLGARARPVPR
jgi:putative transposase